jgi:hypothetical protein
MKADGSYVRGPSQHGCLDRRAVGEGEDKDKVFGVLFSFNASCLMPSLNRGRHGSLHSDTATTLCD